MILIGLDGEMSDSEVQAGAALVQIGVAFSPNERFVSLLGHEPGTYHMTRAGMDAHGISVEEIAAAPRPEVVDENLYAWLVAGLAARGHGTDAKRLVPVGFNVGAFDLPFVARWLPNTYRLLSRRVVDLNAFCLGYANAGKTFEGSTPRWSGWKRLSMGRAQERLATEGIEANWHDAGYDAAAALAILDFLADPC